MESERLERIRRVIENLDEALKLFKKARPDDDLPFLTLCKTFEVLVQYCWKDLKSQVEDQGLFAPSPKEAVRQAAALGMIEDPEEWIAIINARNDSVHDYFNIPASDYVEYAATLLNFAKKMYPLRKTK